MKIFLIVTLISLVGLHANAKTGENCCPGIALKPVTPDTCVSGAENGTMCVGGFFADCKCVNGDMELGGFQYCERCQSSLSGGGLTVIILIVLSPYLTSCCVWFFCCRRKRNMRTIFINRKGEIDHPSVDYVVLENQE
jgi:hypothetical protein